MIDATLTPAYIATLSLKLAALATRAPSHFNPMIGLAHTNKHLRAHVIRPARPENPSSSTVKLGPKLTSPITALSGLPDSWTSCPAILLHQQSKLFYGETVCVKGQRQLSTSLHRHVGFRISRSFVTRV